MGDQYNHRACEITHVEISRRLDEHDQELLTLKEKRDGDLSNIYGKLENQTLVWAEKAAHYAQRPGWATTTIISGLLSITVAAVTYLLARK